MNLQLLRLIACCVLIGASLWACSQGMTGDHALKFLRPFILIVIGITLIPVVRLAQEIFIAYYSGAKYEGQSEEVSFAPALILLGISSVPVLGLFSIVGSRPLLCVFLGVVALIPILADRKSG